MGVPTRARTAVAIRHVVFEDLGAFEAVLTAAGYAVHYADVGAAQWPPRDAADADLLVVLGGPIGAYETDRYPFLGDETALLQARLAAKRPTLGLCLGAQLMALGLGAKVYPGAKEIGFAPVTLTDEGRETLAELSDVRMLHWHGDTFDLPPGAALLASTTACRNQAFAIDRYALAFQFHCEAGGDAFEPWLVGHAVELAQAGIDPRRLRADNAAYGDALRDAGSACLRRWLAGLDA